MERIITGWNWIRIIRLGFGIMICWQAITMKEWVLGIAGLFIAGSALFNYGCCGMGGCATFTKPNPTAENDVTYEVID